MRTVENGAELDAYKGIVPSTFNRFSDKQLIVAAAVKVACIQKVNAVVQRRLDSGNAFIFVVRRPTPDGRHAHTAQSELGYKGAIIAQGYLLNSCHSGCFLLNHGNKGRRLDPATAFAHGSIYLPGRLTEGAVDQQLRDQQIRHPA